MSCDEGSIPLEKREILHYRTVVKSEYLVLNLKESSISTIKDLSKIFLKFDLSRPEIFLTLIF